MDYLKEPALNLVRFKCEAILGPLSIDNVKPVKLSALLTQRTCIPQRKGPFRIIAKRHEIIIDATNFSTNRNADLKITSMTSAEKHHLIVTTEADDVPHIFGNTADRHLLKVTLKKNRNLHRAATLLPPPNLSACISIIAESTQE